MASETGQVMIYGFADCELDTERFELRRDGAVQHVEPQVFDILLYLVERHECFVTKDELHEAVWRGRVVSEAALSSRIKSVRRAVGDNGTDQRLIRTAHGRGFRFIAPVNIRTARGEEEEADTRRECESDAPPHPSGATPIVEAEHQNVVNMAARLQEMAPPSGSCVSDLIHQGVDGETKVRFADPGRQDVKNVSRGVHAFQPMPGDGDKDRRSEAFHSSGFPWHWVAAVGLVTLLAVGGLFTWGAINPEGPGSSAAACTDHLGLPVPIERCTDIQR